MVIVVTNATAVYLSVILCLYNAKYLLRAFGGRCSKKWRRWLSNESSRKGFCKEEYVMRIIFCVHLTIVAAKNGGDDC